MMTLIIPRKEAPVSGEGTVVIPQPAGDEPVIKNTFFFPDIDPKRVRERMRLEQTVAPARPHRFMSVIAAWMPVRKATRRPTALTAPLMSCGGICAGRWRVSRTSRAAS